MTEKQKHTQYVTLLFSHFLLTLGLASNHNYQYCVEWCTRKKLHLKGTYIWARCMMAMLVYLLSLHWPIDSVHSLVRVDCCRSFESKLCCILHQIGKCLTIIASNDSDFYLRFLLQPIIRATPNGNNHLFIVIFAREWFAFAHIFARRYSLRRWRSFFFLPNERSIQPSGWRQHKWAFCILRFFRVCNSNPCTFPRCTVHTMNCLRCTANRERERDSQKIVHFASRLNVSVLLLYETITIQVFACSMPVSRCWMAEALCLA